MKDPYRYFRIEARELVDRLSREVLELERAPATPERIQQMLRWAHTLKDAARVVRRPDIAELAHALESALQPLRDATRALPPDEVSALLARLDAMSAAVAALDGPATPEAPAAPHDLETVRVEVHELDRLLESLSGVRAQLELLRQLCAGVPHVERTAARLGQQLGDEKARAAAEEVQGFLRMLAGEARSALGAAVAEVDRLREQANRLRLVPASVVFDALERVARDVSQELGKRVAFQALGGDNRIDGHSLARLRDGLLHVVRNAVGHGIESEAERVAAGKPPVGRVELRVLRRGGRVTFVCEDDGRGIDLAAIGRAAVRAGAITEAELEELSREEVLQLVFRPGVSSAREVTDLSGRGVGLDVLHQVVAELRGELSVESEPGCWTRFTLTVPVSLSSLAALVVAADGVIASIPLDAVKRTYRMETGRLARTEGRDAIVHGDELIPLVPLRTLLGDEGDDAAEARAAIVLEAGGARAALGVDRMLGASDLVVQPLPRSCASLPLLGASFDARGDAQPVLDPGWLVQTILRSPARATARPSAAEQPVVLVIDDSLTTRMLEQSILEAAGYSVELASSAEEALEKAGRRAYGLFVVDVEMQGMSGFDFVARTRGDAHLRDVPSIIVSSLGSPEDIRRGAEAGARAYIVKGQFDQQQFLDTVRKLIG